MLVPIVERMFAWFGVISVSVLLLRFGRFVYFYFIQGPALHSYRHGNEPWAFITGASAGIGGALGQEITKYGFNVILLGHKREELEQQASTIKAASPNSQTKIVVADATKASFSEIKAILEASNILQLNVSVLINNVGGLGDIFTEYFKPFHRFTPQELDSVLAINNRFMVYLTSIMLPTLVRSPRSLIINIGPIAEIGVPYQTMYSGTKGFIASFSKALDWELKPGPQDGNKLEETGSGEICESRAMQSWARKRKTFHSIYAAQIAFVDFRNFTEQRHAPSRFDRRYEKDEGFL